MTCFKKKYMQLITTNVSKSNAIKTSTIVATKTFWLKAIKINSILKMLLEQILLEQMSWSKHKRINNYHENVNKTFLQMSLLQMPIEKMPLE